ncbi:hypothetical protein NLJ89_g5102 [Agrocybe chaxingu]|uniref:Uncharacterized protein n=1 Tax=Agrocybe chaxingu TaxID=84603 RepID=A0A9W8MTX9_9AGAR|nr:hypothetical protein NLJ89_g5102 [Agrocybe chaxingu]
MFDPRSDENQEEYLYVFIKTWDAIPAAAKSIKLTERLHSITIDITNLDTKCTLSDASTAILGGNKAPKYRKPSKDFSVASICSSTTTFENSYFAKRLSKLVIPSPLGRTLKLNLSHVSLAITAEQLLKSTTDKRFTGRAHDIPPFAWIAHFFSQVPTELATHIEEVSVDIHLENPHGPSQISPSILDSDTRLELSSSILDAIMHDTECRALWRGWDAELALANPAGRWKRLNLVKITICGLPSEAALPDVSDVKSRCNMALRGGTLLPMLTERGVVYVDYLHD